VNLDGHFQPQIEPVNVYDMVSGQLKSYQPMIAAENQDISVDIPDNIYCHADPRLFKKALSNIILNAIQNTPNDGQIQIFTETADKGIQQFTENLYEGIRLCILNTGHIDDAQLPRLFDPFYRMDKVRNRKNRKTGLGLTIVKKTLDLMDMAFWLENTDDGVLFWIRMRDETSRSCINETNNNYYQ